jgi:hypothetical protein
MNVDPSLGKAAFSLALFIVLLAAGMLLLLDRSSPQFAITVFTLLIGLTFAGVVVVVVRRFSR